MAASSIHVGQRAEAEPLEQSHLAAVHQLMARTLKQAAMTP